MGLIDKVRHGLECHKDEIPGVCRDCPYFTESGFCSGRLAKDALKVLDEMGKERLKNPTAGDNKIPMKW